MLYIADFKYKTNALQTPKYITRFRLSNKQIAKMLFHNHFNNYTIILLIGLNQHLKLCDASW